MAERRGYSIIGLFNPKTDANVGSVLRAVGCYGSKAVFIAGKRNKYRKAGTDTQKQYKHTPLILVDDLHSVIPYECVPVAVDLLEDAKSLVEYQHPERAFYIFGPEDGTLGIQITSWCKDKIYVPTKYCMNLAATVNVILYDRMAKGLKTQANN